MRSSALACIAALAILLAAALADGAEYGLSASQERKALEEDSALAAAYAEIEKVEGEHGIDLEGLDGKSALVIVGETLSGPEKAALAAAREAMPKLFAGSVGSTPKTLEEAKATDRTVILIGGPAQNRVSAYFEDEGMLGKRTEYANQMLIASGTNGKGSKIVVLSDKRGFVNLPRKGASYSPLAYCLPLGWVPVAASAIGALMSPLLNMLQAYVENVMADLAKRKHKVDKAARKVLGIKVREVLSVVGAALVLGAAVSWTYGGPTTTFLWLLVLNTLICLLAGLSHEAVHWLAGKALSIETEYRFWPMGSGATLFTAFLGNFFGLQGFLIDDAGERTPKWKLGVMKLASPLFSAAVMLFFAALNFFVPSVFFQMVYSIAAVLAMVEILPFKPMDGHDVRKWSLIAWLIAFLGISASYVLVTFIL